MPLERFCRALHSPPVSNGSGLMAKCPAHDDRQASLSIKAGDDGRVLLHCHAGCEPRAIVDAIGLSLADLFPERPSGEPDITYDYCGADGALLFQVVRFPGKRFRQRRPDGSGGWIWKLDNVARVLYRLPQLRGHREVFVCEGERDTDRLWALGLAATTNPHGAGKWRAEYVEQLKMAGCTRLAIVPDNDPPGEAHARDVARACHGAGLEVRIVPLPGLPPKGDVSDYLEAHSKDDLLEVVRGVPLFDPSRTVATGFKAQLTSLADLLAEPEDAIDWLVQDRIPAGGVTLLAGAPKSGKSTAARSLALAVATGSTWLGWRCSYGAVWLLAFEDKRAEIRRHFRAMGATSCEPIQVFEGQAPANVLAQVHELARTERPSLIIVDTLQRLIRVKDISDYAAVTTAFDPLLKLARDTGAALLLLTHASTHAQRDGLDAVLGSTALSGSVDNVLILRRSERYRTLSSIQRIGPDLEPVVLELDQATGRVVVAGRKRDADQAELQRLVLDVLQNAPEPLTEASLKGEVEGRGVDKERALRVLCGSGRVVRTGTGKRGDAYHYALAIAPSRNTEDVAMSAGGRISAAPATSNLPFSVSPSVPPIRTCGRDQSNSPVQY